MTPRRYYQIRVPFIQWATLTMAAGLALAWLWQRGAMSTVTHDATGVVYMIAAAFVLSMARVGWITWRLGLAGEELRRVLPGDIPFDYRRIKYALAWPQVVASYAPLLGLLGTVAGLQMQIASGQGTDGLATAFGCTMSGIFASVVLGAAIHNCRAGAAWGENADGGY